MVAAGVFLFLTAFCTIPSLISHKKEKGRELLGKIIFVQGGIGAAFFIVAVVLLVSVGIGQAALLVTEFGIVYWMTLFVSYLVVMFAGFILSFGLVQKILVRTASPETGERSERLFLKLVEFQTAAGFFCLMLGIWDILYERVIFPIVHL